MVAESYDILFGIDARRNRAANIQALKKLRLFGRIDMEYDELLLASCIGDYCDALAIVKPHRLAITHTVGFAVLCHRAFPVGKGIQVAAR